MEHISVCICTFKRQTLLKQLLEKLRYQISNEEFTYSVIVVDNDCNRSAVPIVAEFSNTSSIVIEYFCESRQNISHARNMAIENAHGSYMAFIDDDEFPSDTWLLNLYTAFNRYKPNGGVLGPVFPHYPEGTPQWLIESRICDRPNHSTGTMLDWNMTRAGNVLLSQRVFVESEVRFDPKYGRTGGEDKELFRLLMAHGYGFIWCQEAAVYEVIYPERWKLSHYLYRNLMNGGVTGKSIRKHAEKYFIRSLISLLCYAVLIGVSMFIGKHKLYKYIIRVVYDFGRVMGCLGFVLIRERLD